MADNSSGLEKLLLMLTAEVQSRQKKLRELLEQDCDKVKRCEFRDETTGCDHCRSREKCRQASKEISAKLDALEKEIIGMMSQVEALVLLIFIRQKKES